jgi:hypothetical protein
MGHQMPRMYDVLWNDVDEPVFSASRFTGRSEIKIRHRRPFERARYRKIL